MAVVLVPAMFSTGVPASGRVFDFRHPAVAPAARAVVLDDRLRRRQPGLPHRGPQPRRPGLRRRLRLPRRLHVLRAARTACSPSRSPPRSSPSGPRGGPQGPPGVHRPGVARHPDDGAAHAPGRGRHLRAAPPDHRRASCSTASSTPADAANTARALAGFALGLVAFSVYLFTLRGFYAHQDTRTPFVINVVENLLNIVLALVLVGRYGVLGLGLAFAIAYLCRRVGAAGAVVQGARASRCGEVLRQPVADARGRRAGGEAVWLVAAARGRRRRHGGARPADRRRGRRRRRLRRRAPGAGSTRARRRRSVDAVGASRCAVGLDGVRVDRFGPAQDRRRRRLAACSS